MPPLDEIWALYSRRYSLEHSYRFDKQHLLWGEPRLRTPEQFERWTQVVAIVHNQLVLARSLVQAVRLPWESGHRPVTLQQVRRAMGGIIGMLGTPAHRVQPRGKSPGRLPGATVEAAQRFPVVFKPKSTPKKPGKAV